MESQFPVESEWCKMDFNGEPNWFGKEKARKRLKFLN